MDNMYIWNQVQTSDAKYLKEVNFGKWKFTDINAQSQLMKMTEVFGPIGYGWGIRDEKHEIITVGETPVIVYTAQMWYIHWEDEIDFDFPISADMIFKPGDDCYKKVATMARSKGFSFLGFNADVYLKEFDDPSYREHASKVVSYKSRISKCMSNESLDKELERVEKAYAEGNLDDQERNEYRRHIHAVRQRIADNNNAMKPEKGSNGYTSGQQDHHQRGDSATGGNEPERGE